MENTKNQEVLNQIIQEAWGNADFKAALLENPVPAIEALTGEKISIIKLNNLLKSINLILDKAGSSCKTVHFQIRIQ